MYIQECVNANYANQDGESINSNLTNTGTGQDEVCKINDMASNIREWTTEYSSNTDYAAHVYPSTSRGGVYNYIYDYMAYRGNGTSYYTDESVGFRLSLYM